MKNNDGWLGADWGSSARHKSGLSPASVSSDINKSAYLKSACMCGDEGDETDYKQFHLSRSIFIQYVSIGLYLSL